MVVVVVSARVVAGTTAEVVSSDVANGVVFSVLVVVGTEDGDDVDDVVCSARVVVDVGAVSFSVVKGIVDKVVNSGLKVLGACWVVTFPIKKKGRQRATCASERTCCSGQTVSSRR